MTALPSDRRRAMPYRQIVVVASQNAPVASSHYARSVPSRTHMQGLCQYARLVPTNQVCKNYATSQTCNIHANQPHMQDPCHSRRVCKIHATCKDCASMQVPCHSSICKICAKSESHARLVPSVHQRPSWPISGGVRKIRSGEG